MECIGTFFSVLDQFLSADWWGGVSAMALIITLVFVAKYTIATRDMAKATDSMAKVHATELEMRKRPVIQFYCGHIEDIMFRTVIANVSSVHAKVVIKVTITVNGKTLKLTKGHHYSGDRVWKIQAGGTNIFPINGHLSLLEQLEHNSINITNRNDFSAKVVAEIWAAPFDTPDSAVRNVIHKNPIVEYYWSGPFGKGLGGVWIPEVAPVDIVGDDALMASNPSGGDDS